MKTLENYKMSPWKFTIMIINKNHQCYKSLKIQFLPKDLRIHRVPNPPSQSISSTTIHDPQETAFAFSRRLG